MKLLICDDDISTVGVLEHQIPWPSLGISRILQAYNGEAAIQIAVTEKPELIICDIGMPRKNGLDVLKYLRQQSALHEIILWFYHAMSVLPKKTLVFFTLIYHTISIHRAQENN